MECSPLCFGKISDSQCLPPSFYPSQLREAQSIVLLEVAQDAVTLGYPVAQRSSKLGPALAKTSFTLQILTTDWHSGVATCAIRAYGYMCLCVAGVVCVCVGVCGICVHVVCVHGWYVWCIHVCACAVCVWYVNVCVVYVCVCLGVYACAMCDVYMWFVWCLCVWYICV